MIFRGSELQLRHKIGAKRRRIALFHPRNGLQLSVTQRLHGLLNNVQLEGCGFIA
jgi:hypothetical protein